MGYTKGRKRRKLMRFVAAFTTFIVLLSILPDMFNGLGWSDSNKYYDSGKNEYTDKVYQELNAEKGEEIAATIGDKILFSLAIGQAMSALSEDECMDADCWYQALAPSVATLDETGLTMAEKKEVIKQSLADIDVPEGQYQVLEDKLIASLDLSPQAEQGTSDSSTAVPIEETQVAQSAKTDDSEKASPVENPPTVEKAKAPDKPIYSLVELFKGIIHDLGLGFGWAAFYFTALTAVWRGQTPGKKLCGIRVIQLDGTPLSLWDSFGRYGGYGAGIATGLLGFMQIFWDANRQAIHDKISATVVVDAKAVNPRH
ncbi:RDD family protein [Thalassotalea euphylliae]|uniref:RDD family protein n=2 Tax=Thalassotalea euphylliae TaxID=1655234 RepID=A0A3E0TWN0_9GAMM|nr:RDD family protein [Thalassotalea euphylliae]